MEHAEQRSLVNGLKKYYFSTHSSAQNRLHTLPNSTFRYSQYNLRLFCYNY